MDLEFFEGFYLVGWIEPGETFSTATSNPNVLRALEWVYQSRKVMTRGSESDDDSLPRCRVCQKSIWFNLGHQRDLLGYGLLFVRRKEGGYYQCPDLIYHYIQVHKYMPPQCFINDLLDDYQGGRKEGLLKRLMGRPKEPDLEAMRALDVSHKPFSKSPLSR